MTMHLSTPTTEIAITVCVFKRLFTSALTIRITESMHSSVSQSLRIVDQSSRVKKCKLHFISSAWTLVSIECSFQRISKQIIKWSKRWQTVEKENTVQRDSSSLSTCYFKCSHFHAITLVMIAFHQY